MRAFPSCTADKLLSLILDDTTDIVDDNLPVANGHDHELLSAPQTSGRHSEIHRCEYDLDTLADVQATLPDVHFVQATLPDVYSVQATLPDVHFVQATLPDVHSVQATLPDVHSVQATLPDVHSVQEPTPRMFCTNLQRALWEQLEDNRYLFW